MKGKLHFGLMVLCCLIPVAVIFTLPALGVNLGGVAWYLLILLCPAMHLLMMRYMHGSEHTKNHEEGLHTNDPAHCSEALETSHDAAPEDRKSLLPVQLGNRLPVPVSNSQQSRHSED
jgi:hypothetical protein